MFDLKYPQNTDPCCYEDFVSGWHKSKQHGAYYYWSQPVSHDVEFHTKHPPLEIELENVTFSLYYGVTKQELLYRLVFKRKPLRMLIKPAPYCMFWSYGDVGGASKNIKYHYRDRYVALNEWTDKKSFLAVLRQPHYASDLNSFWSRS